MKHPPMAEHVAEMRRREQRRFERARGALGAGNMNGTKWLEVFRLLDGLPGLAFRMKMVGLDHVWTDHRYMPVNRQWTDSTGGPFEHREVEWLEVRGEGAPEARRSIEKLGQLPTVSCEGGFRIQAYGLLRSERTADHDKH